MLETAETIDATEYGLPGAVFSFTDYGDELRLYAYRDGALLASVRLYNNFEQKNKLRHYYWLDQLYVSQQWRNQGVASALLKLICDRYGTIKIKLYAYPEQHDKNRLVKLYRRFGFHVTKWTLPGAYMTRKASGKGISDVN